MAAGVDEGDLAGAGSCYLQKFKLFQTRSKFYMIGWDKSKTIWRVLSIDRQESCELNITEDPTIYSGNECKDLLTRIDEGNRSNGGLKIVTECYGIVGFVKFLGPYYMLLITKRRKIGSICGHTVYGIAESKMITITNYSMISNSENRYKKLLCMVDLTKDFFFSYSYNIMRSLQKNLCNNESEHVLYETMFVWNEFLTRGIRNHLKSMMWTVALVYGFFKQVKLSTSGKEFMFTLISRRSRHYAGTRYLKRGVNEKGRVANEVETEQIVFDANTKSDTTEISSVVQIRGSIPLFWSQDSSWLNMKPSIVLHKNQKYEATRLHFDNLVKRYGNPIVIFNLIKTHERRPRESILRAEFAKAIDFINKDLPTENHLMFLHWDLSEHSQRAKNVLELLVKVGSDALSLTGFFYCQVPSSVKLSGALSLTSLLSGDGINPSTNDLKNGSDTIVSGDRSHDVNSRSVFRSMDTSVGNLHQKCSIAKPPILQKGILRTNCIDCLDRTNVAQYAYGLAALSQQLYLLGLIDVAAIDFDSPLSDDVMDIYEKMGDTLAFQYGGSAAHNKIFCERRGQWKAATQSQEFFRTVQRYYSNTYMDPMKQDAINIFLGYFQPQEDKPALWELSSDQHYNIGRRGPSIANEKARSFKRSLSEGNILGENDASGENDTSSSTSNLGEENSQKVHTSVDAKGLSESTPEFPTCERDFPYSSRYIPLLSRRQLLAESEHGYFHRLRFDESSFSNFLDLDRISSSGNSCEEEIYESSPIVNSPIEKLSSENVIDITTETTSNLSQEGSSDMAAAVGEVDEEVGVVVEALGIGEFSDRFVRWVKHGAGLCY